MALLLLFWYGGYHNRTHSITDGLQKTTSQKMCLHIYSYPYTDHGSLFMFSTEISFKPHF
jgi:hypothetical protein